MALTGIRKGLQRTENWK